MQVQMVRSKIHQARVTAADIHYEGSIGIDTDLLAEAGMFPYERVLVVDIENGHRLETYIIPAAAGSGQIQLNGAAARLVSVGDQVIIMAWVSVTMARAQGWQPRVLLLDAENQIKTRIGEIIME